MFETTAQEGDIPRYRYPLWRLLYIRTIRDATNESGYIMRIVDVNIDKSAALNNKDIQSLSPKRQP